MSKLQAYDLAVIADRGNPNGEVVIDCGAVKDKAARDRADSIFALGVGTRNLTWGPSMESARIFLRIPKRKRSMVLASLAIVTESWFWGSTHRFADSITKEA